MKRLVLAVAALCLTGGAAAEVIDIDNAELARLSAAGIPVIDIRTAPEWRETGIVAGSRLLTFFDAQGQFDAKAWLTAAGQIARPDQPVAVICRSGNRTQAVARFLSQQAGYKTVYNVRNGIKGWIGDGRAVVQAPAIAGCTPPKKC